MSEMSKIGKSPRKTLKNVETSEAKTDEHQLRTKCTLHVEGSMKETCQTASTKTNSMILCLIW